MERRQSLDAFNKVCRTERQKYESLERECCELQAAKDPQIVTQSASAPSSSAAASGADEQSFVTQDVDDESDDDDNPSSRAKSDRVMKYFRDTGRDYVTKKKRKSDGSDTGGKKGKIYHYILDKKEVEVRQVGNSTGQLSRYLQRHHEAQYLEANVDNAKSRICSE